MMWWGDGNQSDCTVAEDSNGGLSAPCKKITDKHSTHSTFKSDVEYPDILSHWNKSKAACSGGVKTFRANRHIESVTPGEGEEWVTVKATDETAFHITFNIMRHDVHCFIKRAFTVGLLCCVALKHEHFILLPNLSIFNTGPSYSNMHPFISVMPHNGCC